MNATTENSQGAPEALSTTRRRKEAEPPTGAALESLSDKVEILRKAVPEALGTMTADLQREIDGLRRELDITHRELELMRRAVAGSRV